jgi:hypothetical protein
MRAFVRHLEADVDIKAQLQAFTTGARRNDIGVNRR